jgi:DDE superfamily endonuclease
MNTIFSSPPFYMMHVHLPTADSVLPPHIRNNQKYWPFFKDCLSAMDGSHIHSAVPASEQASNRNHKGFISQNCLFICDFSFQFCYAVTGWEGSATDAHIYEDACAYDLNIPAGKYYLADAGFPHCPELLVPYRGVQHHLAEWGCANVRCVSSYYILVYNTEIIQDHEIKKNCLIFIMHQCGISLSAYLVF